MTKQCLPSPPVRSSSPRHPVIPGRARRARGRGPSKRCRQAFDANTPTPPQLHPADPLLSSPLQGEGMAASVNNNRRATRAKSFLPSPEPLPRETSWNPTVQHHPLPQQGGGWEGVTPPRFSPARASSFPRGVSRRIMMGLRSPPRKSPLVETRGVAGASQDAGRVVRKRALTERPPQRFWAPTLALRIRGRHPASLRWRYTTAGRNAGGRVRRGLPAARIANPDRQAPHPAPRSRRLMSAPPRAGIRGI